MRGSISPMSIVRIIVVLLHVASLNSRHKEEEADEDEGALPESHVHLVPHFLVQQMDLLQASKVVDSARRIGDGPNAQVVHVSHLGPGVLEFNALGLNEAVLEGDLVAISGGSDELPKVLHGALHVR